VAAYQAAATESAAPVRDRLMAAVAWGNLAAETGAHELAADGFVTAVQLLPQLAGRRVGRGDAQHWLTQYSGLAADAAACALTTGDKVRAVTVLELGRGVLAAQALDGRGDLTELRSRAPELAERFTALSTELERDTARDRLQLAAELDAVLAGIRRLPGLDRFLLPPLLAELTGHAAAGPVALVNVSRYRCDALVLTTDGVEVVELPGLSEDEIRDRVTRFHAALTDGPRDVAERTILDTLEWLWDTVTGPMLRALGFTSLPAPGQPWPRLWWVPVGQLGLLPLPAAGHHRDHGPAVLDRVVSSMIPTVRALGHARNRLRRTGNRVRLVIVAMPETPDAPDLPGVRQETEYLLARFPGAQLLSGSAATREAVLTALETGSWVHFACHGYADPDNPSDSHLVLYDHATAPLRVLDISRQRLADAEFAYLSACDTARTAPGLSDEAIHPAAAFQLAGYPQVVGTLWKIDDDIAPALTESIYDGLLSGAPVAFAVHDTVRRARDRYRNLPSIWAAYVHVGA
jgi:hypothetical protein